MKLKPDEAADVVYDGSDDWEPVKGTEAVIDTTRWSICKMAIFKHIPSGKHYLFEWSVGATESQDESAYEHDDEDIVPIEVSLQEVTEMKWMPVS